MAQFKTHAVVARLVDLLGGDPEMGGDCLNALLAGDPVDAVGLPKRNNISTAKARIIRHGHGNAFIFNELYTRLQASRCTELDSMVLFLSKAIEDPVLKNFLETAATRRPAARAPAPRPSAPTAPQVTPAEARQILAEIAAATADNTAGAPGVGSPGRSRQLGQRREVVAASADDVPAWLVQRPFLTADFPAKPEPTAKAALPIGSLPVEVQEAAIIDDLLFVMLGVDGRYIRAVPKHAGDLRSIGNAADFELDHTLDPSLRDLAGRVLPLAVCYSNVAHFIDGKAIKEGLIRQAVAAGMRALLKEYLIVVAQLETQYCDGDLSLQKLWFYVQPCLTTLDALSAIAVDVVNRDLKGGQLLSLLHDRAVGQLGDSTAAELAHHLAQLASVPYFDMLEQWIYKGVVEDPFDEFMVREDTSIHRDIKMYNDTYWQKRYTVNEHQVPSFLAGMTDRILRTGKYLNVIRESGRSPQYPDAVAIVYQTRGRAYAGIIDDTFAYASASLLSLLNTDLKLKEQLASMKNYFCMLKGDFFSHFIDTAHGELSRLIRDIEHSPSRVTALLEMALRVSSASSDPFHDRLTFKLVKHTRVTELLRIMNIKYDFQGNERGFVDTELLTLDAAENMEALNLKGLDAFTFDYDVQWPVSLVISRRSLKCYQLLFRFLWQCRLVERVLTNTWLDDQYFKESVQLSDASRVSAFALLQRMLNFVQSLQYYSMYEVIEPTWHTMVEKLDKAKTIDDVLAIHNSFLDSCLKGCLLTNVETLKTISKLLSVCDIFGTYNKNIASEVVGPDGSRRKPTVAAAKKFDHSIAAFNDKFNTLMHRLLTTMTKFVATASEQQMSNMVSRLDFNNFYRETWAKEAAAKAAEAPASGDAQPPNDSAQPSAEPPAAALDPAQP
mmetsp:Transcript_19781/g.59030  ORF Transcript_19781/g.59030 Transcript_19781/m.59030 type:complete len:895 (+) Transcript_19781:186-2870(+)